MSELNHPLTKRSKSAFFSISQLWVKRLGLLLYHTSFDSLRDLRSPTFLKSRGSSQTVKINLVNYYLIIQFAK
ncbi:hypothetical protein CEN44_15390 [Fischerella muscicola CCMEE 5323]|uniref:Uncharacterized protein n=1 Tax=Fischerella muscicola CCMEE 5323 TaxID=2019572 RepID=A0A2N6K1F8_FISMU|nr:hypothetical protein CEN44_15390 [Fischerella muscicola CCMEE 5323]